VEYGRRERRLRAFFDRRQFSRLGGGVACPELGGKRRAVRG